MYRTRVFTVPRVPSVPSYRLHKPSGRAVVTIPTAAGRKDVYLGVFNSPESRQEYARVVAELATAATPDLVVVTAAPADATVDEVLLAFWKYADARYRDHAGKPTAELDEVRRSLAPLRRLYGHTPAREFGPKALAAVRNEMVKAGWCRTLVNRRVERVKRAFKWATAEELIPVTVYQALRTLPGLPKGKGGVRESEPVKPVDPAHVAAVLARLNRHVRAMVELQRHTGMRPGEVCRLTLGEVDRTGYVWVYKPSKHKTSHRGGVRVVPIGPKGRAVLEAFLAGVTLGPDDPVFSPVRERAERYAAQRAARKSKVQPSQLSRKKAAPKRVPGETYHPHAYAGAVAHACEKVRIPRWHPNQLRHLFASEVRKTHGVEAAGAVLGHTRMSATEVYAARDEQLAVRVAQQMG